MRLFIGIAFEEPVKKQIKEIQNRIRHKIERANFTNPDNFHLTVSFIGETDRISDIRKLTKTVAQKHSPFSLNITAAGSFRKGNREILWVGSEPEKRLTDLAADMAQTLTENVFSVDRRPIVPHITLAREAIVADKTETVFIPIEVEVNSLTLFQSTRINGKLTYLPLFRWPLMEKKEDLTI